MARSIDAAALERVFHQPPDYPNNYYYREPNMRAIEYRGETIKRVKHTQLHDNIDFAGFPCDHVFMVVDDMTGEPSLPITNPRHWTPFDAMHAIDIAMHVKKHIKNQRKWPTTIAHEVNMAIAMRRSFGPAYVALLEIEEMCRDAKIFDENPADQILKRIALLRQVVQEGAK